MESADIPVGQVPEPQDKLQVYGFSFEFPKKSKLEFNPKFKREDGDVAVKSPEKAVVFVSWGELEKIIKRAPTIEDHAKFSLDRVRKSVQGRMTVVDREEVVVNGHTALSNHVKVEVPRRGFFGKPREQEVRSVHLHCDQSSRYFVIYATCTAENTEEQGRTVKGICETFHCH